MKINNSKSAKYTRRETACVATLVALTVTRSEVSCVVLRGVVEVALSLATSWQHPRPVLQECSTVAG